MGKYGETAILARTFITKKKVDNPIDAWKQAVVLVFPDSESCREKSCPKSTFLSLCEKGLVIGVPSGSYTRSIDNKRYAVEAINQLRKNPSLAGDEEKLWNSIIHVGTKVENSQMDVVTTLWREGLIANDT